MCPRYNDKCVKVTYVLTKPFLRLHNWFIIYSNFEIRVGTKVDLARSVCPNIVPSS